MRTRFAFTVVIVLLLGAGWGRAVVAAPAAAGQKEGKSDAGEVSADEINALIAQLGADDYAKREQASKRLKAIGKPALAGLKAATSSEDVEVAARARVLVERISVRPLPEPVPGGVRGLVRQTRMRVTPGEAGGRVIDVSEGGRDVLIREGPEGITMTVAGLVDGQPGSEEYTAATAEQLKEDNPEAYALYQRWTGAAGPNVFLRGGGGIRILGGGRIQINGGQLLLQGLPDEVDLLRARLDKQMIAGKLKEADRAEVNKGLEKLAEARVHLVGGMEKYSDQCDEFRKVLEQYKLDPGDLLPPPAKTRLGVSIGSGDGRLTVQRVGENSRAARLGLESGDVIRKVDGKDVATVGELRTLVAAKEKGLVVEVTRDGEELKLTEKEGKKGE
jgi:hypothetical protein